MQTYDTIAILRTDGTPQPVAGLQMVAWNGLAVALSASPEPVVRDPDRAKARLRDMAHHVHLQETLLPLGTVLPVQAGERLSLAGAERLLQANHGFLTRLMHSHPSMVQVQITVRWQEDLVLSHFRQSAELEPIFASAATGPLQLATAIGALRQRLAFQINDLLLPATRAIAELPRTSDVLWNAAVLIAPQDLSDLLRAVETVDALWTEGLHIRQVGPAPMASFVLLALQPVSGQHARLALDRCSHLSARHRRQSLQGELADPALREAFRTDLRIAEAAGQVPEPERGFHLVEQIAGTTKIMSQQEVA